MQSIQYFAPEAEDDLSSHAYRQAIGWLGVLLPWLLLPLARWRAVGVFPDWQPLDSISQYYYSGATALLTGALAALAIFFLTDRGFANESKWADQTLGKIAGLAALGRRDCWGCKRRWHPGMAGCPSW